MIESIAIDFRPGDTAVPAILSLLDQEGYTLRGIRLVPTPACERSTLRLDVGDCPSGAQLYRLAEQLGSLDGIIEVIHRAKLAS